MRTSPGRSSTESRTTLASSGRSTPRDGCSATTRGTRPPAKIVDTATTSAYTCATTQITTEPAMQFGVFSVGDVTTDPTTGRTPTEHERIESMIEIALKAEEIGLDVFATGEHHNPPFVPSSPTTTLGFIAAKTSRLTLSTATTLITTNDPVKIAEDYAMLQHIADGRVDLMLGRGNTGPVYPWFGQDIRNGIALAVE